MDWFTSSDEKMACVTNLFCCDDPSLQGDIGKIEKGKRSARNDVWNQRLQNGQLCKAKPNADKNWRSTILSHSQQQEMFVAYPPPSLDKHPASSAVSLDVILSMIENFEPFRIHWPNDSFRKTYPNLSPRSRDPYGVLSNISSILDRESNIIEATRPFDIFSLLGGRTSQDAPDSAL